MAISHAEIFFLKLYHKKCLVYHGKCQFQHEQANIHQYRYIKINDRTSTFRQQTRGSAPERWGSVGLVCVINWTCGGNYRDNTTGTALPVIRNLQHFRTLSTARDDEQNWLVVSTPLKNVIQLG